MNIPFKVNWILITPPQARDWLTHHNPSNRPLRRAAVEAMARDMKAGAWMPNHQGIALNEAGELIDGQHRLCAIATSGCSIWMLVFKDVPDHIDGVTGKMMDTIDRGAPRSIADLLTLHHGIESGAGLAAASCVCIARLFLGPHSNASRKLTMNQTLAILGHWGKPITQVTSVLLKNNNPFRAAPIASAIAFAAAVDEPGALDFLKGLISGAGLADGDPALALRNYWIFAKEKGGGVARSGASYRTLLTLHLLDARRRGQVVRKIPSLDECTGHKSYIAEQPEGEKIVRSVCVALNAPPSNTPRSKVSAPVPAATRNARDIADRADKFRQSLRRVKASE